MNYAAFSFRASLALTSRMTRIYLRDYRDILEFRTLMVVIALGLAERSVRHIFRTAHRAIIAARRGMPRNAMAM